MSAHEHENASLKSTLVGLVRLLLVVLAIPAVLAGAAAALVVLALAAPLLLVRKLYRLLRASRQGGRLQIWAAF
jgi:hypothetical protein